MRVAVWVMLCLGACGKQVNPEFCGAHPTHEVCLAADAGGSAMADAAHDAHVVSCPSYYDVVVPSQPSSRYLREDSVNDWDSAVVRCAADQPGATHLAVIGSAAELADLAPYFDRTRFIGLSDKVVDGTYLAVTDEVVDFPGLYVPAVPPWKPGEPDNSGDCVSITNNLEVEDQDCTGATVDLAWLCECDGYSDRADNY